MGFLYIIIFCILLEYSYITFRFCFVYILYYFLYFYTLYSRRNIIRPDVPFKVPVEPTVEGSLPDAPF
jgi:hypothetical protein